MELDGEAGSFADLEVRLQPFQFFVGERLAALFGERLERTVPDEDAEKGRDERAETSLIESGESRKGLVARLQSVYRFSIMLTVCEN